MPDEPKDSISTSESPSLRSHLSRARESKLIFDENGVARESKDYDGMNPSTLSLLAPGNRKRLEQARSGGRSGKLRTRRLVETPSMFLQSHENSRNSSISKSENDSSLAHGEGSRDTICEDLWPSNSRQWGFLDDCMWSATGLMRGIYYPESIEAGDPTFLSTSPSLTPSLSADPTESVAIEDEVFQVSTSHDLYLSRVGGFSWKNLMDVGLKLYAYLRGSRPPWHVVQDLRRVVGSTVRSWDSTYLEWTSSQSSQVDLRGSEIFDQWTCCCCGKIGFLWSAGENASQVRE